MASGELQCATVLIITSSCSPRPVCACQSVACCGDSGRGLGSPWPWLGCAALRCRSASPAPPHRTAPRYPQPRPRCSSQHIATDRAGAISVTVTRRHGGLDDSALRKRKKKEKKRKQKKKREKRRKKNKKQLKNKAPRWSVHHMQVVSCCASTGEPPRCKGSSAERRARGSPGKPPLPAPPRAPCWASLLASRVHHRGAHTKSHPSRCRLLLSVELSLAPLDHCERPLPLLSQPTPPPPCTPPVWLRPRPSELALSEA